MCERRKLEWGFLFAESVLRLLGGTYQQGQCCTVLESPYLKFGLVRADGSAGPRMQTLRGCQSSEGLFHVDWDAVRSCVMGTKTSCSANTGKSEAQLRRNNLK